MDSVSIVLAKESCVVLDDCWKRIGVRGDGSCPLLRQYLHCHNCPTHAAAAQSLLDREAPADYLFDCTRQMAQASQVKRRDTASAVIFREGAEWLALPTSVFLEVAALRAVHPLPDRRDGVVQGVANVRGELLVCISIARVLGLEPAAGSVRGREAPASRRLVVIGVDGLRLGFAVDEMHGIHRFDPDALKTLPGTVVRVATTCSRAILPWRDHAVALLDEHLLSRTLQRSFA